MGPIIWGELIKLQFYTTLKCTFSHFVAFVLIRWYNYSESSDFYFTYPHKLNPIPLIDSPKTIHTYLPQKFKHIKTKCNFNFKLNMKNKKNTFSILSKLSKRLGKSLHAAIFSIQSKNLITNALLYCHT